MSEITCLVTEVRNVLLQSGLGREVEANFDTSSYIKEAVGKPPQAQRNLLNRFWNIQLLTAPNTTEARFCLIPQGSDAEWLSLFRNQVVPLAIDLRLPTRI